MEEVLKAGGVCLKPWVRSGRSGRQPPASENPGSSEQLFILPNHMREGDHKALGVGYLAHSDKLYIMTSINFSKKKEKSPKRHMEDRTESPMAVKVEKYSQYIILTYFHGDINSMVDAHFSRALGTVSRDKGPAKKKKTRKSMKSEKTTHSQEFAADTYPRAQLPAEGLLTLSPMDDAPEMWHPFTASAGESAGLPSIAYSLSPEGLSLTGQQYATSLLNLLHNEQADVGPSLASSSKPEMHPSWAVQAGLREPVEPAMVFRPGRCLDKKDLYWY